MKSNAASVITTGDVQRALRDGREVALLDVREEGPFADAHPLFAALLPFGRIELDIADRVPRLTTPIVVYDNGEGLAERAVARLTSLGYSNVAQLDGGLQGWRVAGGELFRDVNVPSKAFGELVEARRHTPSLSADEVSALIAAGEDVVVLDVRRHEEYSTMSIPTAVSVPGGELVYRVGDAAPRPETLVVVNCAGRTRGIIGTQSLVNAGVPNRVVALRNGTIGWVLAGHQLDKGQARRWPDVSPERSGRAREAARSVADRAGVGRATRRQLDLWATDSLRTTYRFDVRTPDEYAAGHPRTFRSAPGGQLVQETDVFAPVRGARIVLWDDATVRADMTASWLAQMGWEVYVLDVPLHGLSLEQGAWRSAHRAPPSTDTITREELRAAPDGTVVIDFAPARQYEAGHVPGAWSASRTYLPLCVGTLPVADCYVLASFDGDLAAFAAADFAPLVAGRVTVLAGGTRAWTDANLPLETTARFVAPPVDVYKRPYKGTDNASEAMQAYLDWEYGLVAQLDRDGTHNFHVI